MNRSARACATACVAVMVFALSEERSADAQALKRFDRSHRGSSSPSRSSPSRPSSGSHRSRSIHKSHRDLFPSSSSRTHERSESSEESGPPRPVVDNGGFETGWWWTALDLYGDDDEGTAYLFPYKQKANGKWEQLHKSTGRGVRLMEFTLGSYLPTNEKVYVFDFGARLFVGTYMLEFTWDHFREPGRVPEEETTELNWKRLHLGINPLGEKSKEVELYAILGASVMGLAGLDGLWAFDVGAQARAYPKRPFMFYASTLMSIFAKGPPLIDLLFQTGVSLGRFDFRVGLRALKQDPDQSFVGPAATIAFRL